LPALGGAGPRGLDSENWKYGEEEEINATLTTTSIRTGRHKDDEPPAVADDGRRCCEIGDGE
jgi:hypothetical protein